MDEYAERYAPFAKFLNECGYVVCAEDHLGHGKSVTTDGNLGYFAEGNAKEIVLADIRELTNIVRDKYPELPFFIVGHSMGSYLTRIYLTRFGEGVSGAILMGTGYESGARTSLAKIITGIVATFKGWHYRSKFVNNLAFGSYNKKIKNKRCEYDWLSANESNVDSYINDELCGVPFTCNGFYTLFSIVNDACKSKTVKAMPKKLPIFLISGKDDPVGGYSKGVVKLYDKLIANGGEDISLTLYECARHEIVNDNCAPQVYSDVKEFLDGLI
jgi:alpha-beta hydrolase superfamily lysophospholipase